MKITDRFRSGYIRRQKEILEHGIFTSFRSGKKNGYALIIVLLITSLLIALTSTFIAETQTAISYMRTFDGRLKSGCLARSGVELAKMILTADKQGIGSVELTGRTADKDTDSYNDIWALDFPLIPLDDGSIKIEIDDENSKININAFANEFTEMTKYYYMAGIFFMNMGLSPDLADVMHDWIDIDDSRLANGAESSDFYMTQIPPYRAKNTFMDSIDECLMMKGMTPEIFYGLGGGNFGTEENLVDDNKGDRTVDPDRILALAEGSSESIKEEKKESKTVDEIKTGREKNRALSEYFRVWGDTKDFLHEYNKININTASFRVISALTENITDDTVSAIIRQRLVQPFSSVNDLKSLLADDAEFESLQKYITVKSCIFRIRATGIYRNSKTTVTVYYNRDTKKILSWSEE